MPAFAGISVFRWDIKLRESTVLGLVGAGGIGLQLDSSISTLGTSKIEIQGYLITNPRELPETEIGPDNTIPEFDWKPSFVSQWWSR